MTSDPFYKPGLVIPPRQPRPGERLWTLQKGGRRLDGELPFHGESYGWEFQLLRDGELYAGRRYPFHRDALAFADEERRVLEQSGWTLIDAPTPAKVGIQIEPDATNRGYEKGRSPVLVSKLQNKNSSRRDSGNSAR